MKKILLLVLLILGITLTGCGGSDTKDKPAPQQSSSEIKEDKNLIDPKIAENNIALITAGGFSESEAIQINDILQSVGLQKLTKFEGVPKYMEDMGYMVSAEQLGPAVMPVYFNQSDKTVKKIVYKNVTLYENGQLKDTIASGTITKDETNRAMSEAERFIKKQLKDPSSAKFPGKYWVSKANNVIRVKGYVDAKNSFNAMVRSDFVVEFDSNMKPKSYSITSRE